MTVKNRDGFTLVEVLVSVVILAIGSLMLASGSLFVTRELVRTRGQTAAQAMAQAKSDELRALAASTNPACASASFIGGSAAATNGVTMSWSITGSGSQRTVAVISSYKLGRNKTHTDTLTSFVPC
jgi:prepilin-type N-terminal cleavage/methylation domain-containing protein